MARVSVIEVKEILDDNDLDVGFVSRMITAANTVVNQVFSDDTTVTAQLLKQIEMWFTAHIIASTPLARTVQSEKLEGAGTTYTGKFGAKLDSTPYGQMVQTLDYTGKMARLGQKLIQLKAIPQFEE